MTRHVERPDRSAVAIAQPRQRLPTVSLPRSDHPLGQVRQPTHRRRIGLRFPGTGRLLRGHGRYVYTPGATTTVLTLRRRRRAPAHGALTLDAPVTKTDGGLRRRLGTPTDARTTRSATVRTTGAYIHGETWPIRSRSRCLHNVATQTVNVGVTPVNDAPVTTATVTLTTPEDKTVAGQVVATDVGCRYARLHGRHRPGTRRAGARCSERAPTPTRPARTLMARTASRSRFPTATAASPRRPSTSA